MFTILKKKKKNKDTESQTLALCFLKLFPYSTIILCLKHKNSNKTLNYYTAYKSV
jgi:hypothetical protein